jgi:hypothetical protein
MRKDKRKRLEAKGWKVGDAAAFLGLTAAEELLVRIRTIEQGDSGVQASPVRPTRWRSRERNTGTA